VKKIWIVMEHRPGYGEDSDSDTPVAAFESKENAAVYAALQQQTSYFRHTHWLQEVTLFESVEEAQR
jgi:hypothetical protein